MQEAYTQSIRFTVGGRVQGVCYRAATREQAGRLALDGWVRNLADGQVELVVRGAADSIERLAAWLWQGPPAARVSSVTLEDYTGEIASGFEIR